MTPITTESLKTIKLVNPSSQDVEHITAIAFDAGANEGGHFKIEKVEIGGNKVTTRDITVPAGGYVSIGISYTPKNLKTTEADYGLWHTDSEEPATEMMIVLASGALRKVKKAVHRSVLVVQYDYPRTGNVYIELVGEAVTGPDGEEEWSGGEATGECAPSETMLCYEGNFSIDLPGLMASGALEVPMTGMIPFHLDNGSVTLDMNEFPDVLIGLRGNGSGEPLEGKPVSAITILIDGAPDVTATGSFDGSAIFLDDVGFRIRVVLGSITQEQISEGINASVDFSVEHLTMTTTSPFDGERIILEVTTTLSSNPSGNKLFDQFLGGAEVIVKFDGSLLQ